MLTLIMVLTYSICANKAKELKMFRPEAITTTLKQSVTEPKGARETVAVCKKALQDIPQRLKSRRRKSRVSVALVIV